MPANNKRKRSRRKGDAPPRKPPNYKDFPLYAHPLGYWSKKVDGKIMHFGRWGRVVNGRMKALPFDAGWREALANFKARVDDAHLGRIRGFVVTPSQAANGSVTIADVCNEFLTAKLRKLESGGISRRTFDEYKSTTDRLIKQFGDKRRVEDLVASDFGILRADLAKVYGPYRLGNEVQKVRTVFRYAHEAGIIDKPVRFGPEFVKPSEAEIRKHRAKGGKRLLSPEECRWLLDAAEGKQVVIGKNEKTGKAIKFKGEPNPQLRAMLLLGLNAGFGNHDVATLPFTAEDGTPIVDLKRGWIEYARPKSGIERRCPLWPETVAALQAAIAARPKPKEKDAEGLVFVTARGRPWLSRGIANPVSVVARSLMKQCGVNGRKGVGFYTLRHVFRTVADGSKDQPAIRLIMGHKDPGIDAVYRETIDDGRLMAVVQHVHDWLFGEGGEK